MIWDNVSGIYDFTETVYNGKVYRRLGETVAAQIKQDDLVLECACGTGAISKYIAPRCRHLTATDFSTGMLRQTAKNCQEYDNVTIRRADLTQLKCRDNKYDKVVAGNVLHLLDKPVAAVKELERVCKTGGKISFRRISTEAAVSIGWQCECLSWRACGLGGSLSWHPIKSSLRTQGTNRLRTLSSTEECPVQWQ